MLVVARTGKSFWSSSVDLWKIWVFSLLWHPAVRAGGLCTTDTFVYSDKRRMYKILHGNTPWKCGFLLRYLNWRCFGVVGRMVYVWEERWVGRCCIIVPCVFTNFLPCTVKVQGAVLTACCSVCVCVCICMCMWTLLGEKQNIFLILFVLV